MQFVRYVVAGGMTALIELGSFSLLIALGWWYVLANVVAFSLAVLFGFFVQKYFTFRNQQKQHSRQAAKFLVIIGIGFILTNLYLWMFIDLLNWPPFVAKCVQLILVMFSNYAGQKWFTFREVTL